MAEKNINARVQHKHDVEANWLKASSFVPKQGEIVVYDVDSTHTYERIKIGDGTTVVGSLPFINDEIRQALTSGTTKVSKAETADRATTADSATSAQTAQTAVSAQTADSATVADTALVANSATKATQDGNGKVIADTYETKTDAVNKLNEAKVYTDQQIENATDECITGMSVSGKTITYAKGDGSTGMITTQDTTYSIATTSAAGLMSAADKTKLDGFATINNLKDGSATGSLRSVGATSESSSYSLGQNAFAVGYFTTASGDHSHAEGYRTTASGESSHAEGDLATASGNYSHAEGYRTTASGNYSHAEGEDTIAFGSRSHSEGYLTTASGNYSHAEGYRTTASGESSHAEGENTTAFGLRSHAEGRGLRTNITLTGEASSTNYQVSTWNNNIKTGTVIIYQNSTAKIVSINEANKKIVLNQTLSDVALSDVSATLCYVGVASGDYSHMEGNQSIASGSTSHAEGEKTIASGAYSHAEGEKTIASSARSHAEGSNTIASGVCSHAEGSNTIASGKFSHAEGYYTIASSNHQHVQGKYNIEDSSNKYAHIVGNGSSDTSRSNAHTLDWNGVGWFKGGLKVGGTSQDDAAAVEVALKSEATTSKAGLMSASDKSKLDGIQSGANAYTLPAAGSSLGGVKTGGDVTISGGIITVDRDGIVEDAVQEVIIQLGGLPVFGMVDSNNNINITAALEDGVYTLKYENADGSTTEIGTLVVENNAPAYINLADSTSSDWLTNQRINSSGNVVEVTATQRGDDTVVITNFIDIAGVQKLHVKGLDVLSALSSGQNYGRFYVYDSNKSLVVKTAQPSNTTYVTVADYDSSVWIIDCEAYLGEWGYSDERYVRLGGILTGAAEGVIITADENIV